MSSRLCPRSSHFVPAWCRCSCNRSRQRHRYSSRHCSSELVSQSQTHHTIGILEISLNMCEQHFYSSSSSHVWTTPEWHRVENNHFDLVLPVFLHIHFRHLLGIFVRPNGTLYCARHRARFLQPHGLSWHTGIDFTSWTETLHFHACLRAGPGGMGRNAAYAHHARAVF